MDLPAQPTLVDLPTENGITPAIIQPAKTGNLFVLDRRAGQLIVPHRSVRFRREPRSEITYPQRSHSRN
jgi:quinoprotein glucose dehydrogenase